MKVNDKSVLSLIPTQKRKYNDLVPMETQSELQPEPQKQPKMNAFQAITGNKPSNIINNPLTMMKGRQSFIKK